MDARLQIVAVFAASGLLLGVLELVRRRRLLERYALVWLGAAVLLLGLAIWDGALAGIASALGIVEGPNALFFVAFTAILLLLLHFSVAVSRLTDQSKILAQRLGLLEERVRERPSRAERLPEVEGDELERVGEPAEAGSTRWDPR